jgi:hypothetical protein
VISIDVTISGAGTATPPAVCVCSADQVVLMAPFAAPPRGTGLPVAGTPAPVRFRGLITAAGTTGSFPGVLDAAVRPSVQTAALRNTAVVGVPAGHISSTPGDLPPEDPLS